MMTVAQFRQHSVLEQARDYRDGMRTNARDILKVELTALGDAQIWGRGNAVVRRSQELSKLEADVFTSNKCTSLLVFLVCQRLLSAFI